MDKIQSSAVPDSRTVAGVKYYVRRDRGYYYDIADNGACFGLEGRAAIYACRPFNTALEAEHAALNAGIAETEFEIVAVNP